MLREPLTLQTADGLALEAELALPDGFGGLDRVEGLEGVDPWAAAVLTHPHPRHGGNMRSMVPGELITALAAMGVATLRFNFRGMGTSEGQFEDGVGERLDIVAALDALCPLVEGLPLALCGSSFGADTALTVDDSRIDGWCAMAPPLREHRLANMAEVGADTRPKYLVVAERDQYRGPESVKEVTTAWLHTQVEVIPGADHFFIGRIDLVVAACCNFVKTLASNRT